MEEQQITVRNLKRGDRIRLQIGVNPATMIEGVVRHIELSIQKNHRSLYIEGVSQAFIMHTEQPVTVLVPEAREVFANLPLGAIFTWTRYPKGEFVKTGRDFFAQVNGGLFGVHAFRDGGIVTLVEWAEHRKD